MENTCTYINSRGILKSCNFHASNPKSSCKTDKKYLLDMITNMFDGMSIYVCSHLLKYFVNDILPKIKQKFVLVSGDSDLCVPIEILTQKEYNILINSNFLIKWFVQNTKLQHINKIFQLPIGLDYHTILNNPIHSWLSEGESHLPIDQEKLLINIKENSKPFFERNIQIYVNFNNKNDRFNQRKASIKQIPNNLLVICNNFIKRTENWNNITNYAFVLSPFGNGMDCHRTWEALCLGSIPIIKAPFFVKLFEDLPVLIVNDWNEITEDLLKSTIENFKFKKFNYDKLKLSYWVNLINTI